MNLRKLKNPVLSDMYVITIYTLSASLVFVVLLLHVTAKIIKNTNWMSGFRRWAHAIVFFTNAKGHITIAYGQ
jgi:hypothetical protein